MKDNYQIIVPGGLNTDIIGLGVDSLIGEGELSLGGSLKIGPGGKARNMAQMCSTLLGRERVVMLGKTVRDPYGLWNVPIDSLMKAGVCTDHIRIIDYDPEKPLYPGIALIPVDKDGNNQIYVLPGVNSDFSPDDLYECRHLFRRSEGFVLMALEIPADTILMALNLAERNRLKVILDPGGINEETARSIKPALKKVFLIKPNEHEAEILTGIRIKDKRTAGKAADELLSSGVNYVLITHGAEGGYLFGNGLSLHFPAPGIHGTGEKDATACGDQVSATLTTALVNGYSIEEAVKLAIKAGTLQFNRMGVNPVSYNEIFK